VGWGDVSHEALIKGERESCAERYGGNIKKTDVFLMAIIVCITIDNMNNAKHIFS
jgi:hypothetical protein